jgi:hypothetical protein
LVLIGTLSTGALTGCEPDASKFSVSANNVYTNNYFVPGVGYYHAPFRAWYAMPYNHFDLQNQLYFFGGQWGASPHQSITNISAPTPEIAAMAQAQRTDITRGGFGRTSRSHWIHS